jgi:hypothetical protein
VYVLCGHVHGNHQWGVKNDNNQSRECPLCRTVGPLIPIIPGLESAFYVIPNNNNESTTSHAFHPCGHMTSQSTALYWSKIKVPYGRRKFKEGKMNNMVFYSRNKRFKNSMSILFNCFIRNKTICSSNFSRFYL